MLTLKKNDIFLQFDEENGTIHSLHDAKREFVGEKTAVFKVGLRDQAGEQILVEMADMCLAGYVKEKEAFKAVYEGCNMVITVYAELTDSIAWKIAIELKDDRVVEWVNFPQIAVPHDLKDNNGTSKILWGFNEGALVDDLTYKEKERFRYREPQYPSKPTCALYPAIVETQFMAYYNEKSGLYFGAHDKEDHLKGIDFYPYKAGIMLHMRHYCNVYYGQNYEMDYPVVMKFFRGEWQDAAQIYRDWFKKNKNTDYIPIIANKSLPDWYAESPVIITYPVRGRHDGDVMNPNKMFPYCNAMKHVERLERELNSKIMVILMHWEGTAPWAPPYVWPPYGGEEELRKFIDALHERGDVFGVYCSGIGWTQYSKIVDNYNREKEYEEKNLQDVMCLSPNQELPYCAVVPSIRAGYDMCPSQKFVEDVLCQEVRSMVAADIDYIQLMDQQHGGNSYFCYSKNHGHPPVPGKWQVDAMKHLYSQIKKESGKVLIGTESAAAESFIPYLQLSDNRFELNYATGRPVPVYAYVFHEYLNNFMGNQVCASDWLDHEKSPENLLERMAYSFSAGDLMTLVLNENGEITWNWGWRVLENIPDQDNVKAFVKNANMWRRGIGKKYLHTGSMVKPYQIDCDKNVIQRKNGYEFLVEKIHTSAWEAEDGSYGQFLINYNTESVECQIHLPDGNYKLYEDETHFIRLSGGLQKLHIKRLSVVMLEKTE